MHLADCVLIWGIAFGTLGAAAYCELIGTRFRNIDYDIAAYGWPFVRYSASAVTLPTRLLNSCWAAVMLCAVSLAMRRTVRACRNRCHVRLTRLFALTFAIAVTSAISRMPDVVIVPGSYIRGEKVTLSLQASLYPGAVRLTLLFGVACMALLGCEVAFRMAARARKREDKKMGEVQ